MLRSDKVAGPVVAYLVAGARMTNSLDSLKAFMQAHNTVIMVDLLSVLGVSNVGKGLGGLLS